MGTKNKRSKKIATGNSTVANGGAAASSNNKDKKIIDDPRFARVHYDPRFQKVPKRTSKVSIDSRFNEIFTDKRFASSLAKVDKRGKPRKETENALRRYYHLDDEEDEGEVKKKKEKKKKKKKSEESEEHSSGSSSSSAESSEFDSESDKLGSTSDSDSDTASDSDDDDEIDMLENDEDFEVENVPVIEKETHRLAVVNMEWNQVKAVDLFMMLRSFLPKGGQIKSVAVYPSEFGIKRMEEEAIRGPVALLGDDKEKKGGDDEEDDDDDNDDDDDDEIDTEKLRAYEKSRLRYYYAVVDCDSVATADYLYKACDGVEFERSSNVLDLRFIPDSMEFPHPPRDVAKGVPSDYEGLDFHTRALQLSNVNLSWDDDEPHRVKTLRRKFNEDQLAELELKEFLASDSDESDGDSDSDEGEDEDEDEDEDEGEGEGKGEEGDKDPSDNENKEEMMKKKKKKKKAKLAKKDLYRALVQSGDGSGEDEDEGQDMEVTFNTGLEDISKKILEKKDKGSETVWEAYLRKKREKKKARKYKSKNSSDDESDESDQEPLEQPDDFFEDERTAVRSKKATHGKKKMEENKLVEDEERAASRAELELLLADEMGTDNNVKGYKIKQKKGKGKKGKEALAEDKLPTIDYNDPRFSALFTNPGFALDPTDPQFKRSATYFRQLAKWQVNDSQEHAPTEQVEPSKPSSNDTDRKKDEISVGMSRKEKFELSSIVKSIKLKSQQLPKPSGVQLKKDKMENGSAKKEKKHKLKGLEQKVKKKAKV